MNCNSINVKRETLPGQNRAVNESYEFTDNAEIPEKIRTL